ncbi:MAG: WecB/TagA/CpsF family glycosyltransferase [Anaerolineae bacterium]|nr:WecB/TagA/CpsF family glycosyltransferase [Anaerolineae bacterium]
MSIFESVDILGVRVDDVSWDEMLAAITHLVKKGGTHRIATVNTEYIMAAQRDPEFARILRHTEINVPDSAGVLAAAWWLGHPLRERVTGSDGIYRIAELCTMHHFRLFLLGAGPNVAARVADILAARYPDLIVCGTHPGLADASVVTGAENDAVTEQIRSADSDVLLIAYPQIPQEKWLSHNQAKTGAPVAMGVGAAFDFVAGVQKRAPRWLQRLGLEWLYRLIREPQRWKRMLALPYTAWLVFWQRFTKDRIKDET